MYTVTYDGTTLTGSGWSQQLSDANNTWGYRIRYAPIGTISNDYNAWKAEIVFPVDEGNFIYLISIPSNSDIRITRYGEYNDGDGNITRTIIEGSPYYTYIEGESLGLDVISSFAGISNVDVKIESNQPLYLLLPFEGRSTADLKVDFAETLFLQPTIPIISTGTIVIEYLEPFDLEVIIQAHSSITTTILLIPVCYLEPITIFSSSYSSTIIETLISSIKGNVTLNGKPIAYANIYILNEEGTRHYRTITNSFGHYEIAVPPDTYHAFCIYKDANQRIFSSMIQPYISAV